MQGAPATDSPSACLRRSEQLGSCLTNKHVNARAIARHDTMVGLHPLPAFRMSTAIQRLAIVVNPNKPGAQKLAEYLTSEAIRLGLTCDTTIDYPIAAGFLEGKDACCVIGGDGTLLGVVAEAVRFQVPAMGVNLGKLGFMATFTEAEARQRFSQVLAGDYRVVARSLIECSSSSGGRVLVLNDVVVKDASNRLVGLEVLANGRLVNEYYCDGLVFATPTGSTAYNLSAGGPIVHPSAQVIALTPICPHTLSNRSVIFDHETVLGVVLCEENATAQVIMDGHHHFEKPNDFPLQIKIAAKSFPLIQHRNFSHFELVRSKLNWRAQPSIE